MPAIKNLGKANLTVSAARQLLDDVARARQLAISQHTTVYMIFVDASFWNTNAWHTQVPQNYLSTAAVTNLCDKQLTGYTFVSERSVGDQPGRGTTNYLAAWQNLPEGNFIAQWKFGPHYATNYILDPVTKNPLYPLYRIQGFSRTTSAANNDFLPYPTLNSPGVATNLPYIAFNYQGQLTTEQLSPAPSPQDEYIPLAQGTVAPDMDGRTKIFKVNHDAPAVTEVPAGNSTNSSYNVIHIDWLTGHARQEQQKVQ